MADFSLKMSQKRSVWRPGLRPDLLRELTALPQTFYTGLNGTDRDKGRKKRKRPEGTGEGLGKRERREGTEGGGGREGTGKEGRRSRREREGKFRPHGHF